MDTRLIRFPPRRRTSPTGAAGHPSASAKGVRPPDSVGERRGEPIVVASLEIAPLAGVDGGRWVRDRCLLAAVRELAERGGSVALAGSEAHPVIEARFQGSPAPRAGCGAVLAAARAVSRAQRSHERGLALTGGLAVGRERATSGGVRVASGSAPALAERLREVAAPGQLLLGGAAWADVEAHLDTVWAPALPELGTAPVRILRGERSDSGA